MVRYTRYNYRNKNKNKLNVLFGFVVVVVLAVFIGTGLFNSIFKDKTDILPKKSTDASVSNNKSENSVEFAIVQCGVYSKKEVADETLKKIPSTYPAFIIEESGKFKVIAGIFNIDNVNDKMNELKAMNIENFRIKCNVSSNVSDKAVEEALINNYLQIVNKVCEKDVKSVNIAEFKQWIADNAELSCEKNSDIKEMVENIKNNSDEYTRDKVKDSMNFIYKIIVKYKE